MITNLPELLVTSIRVRCDNFWCHNIFLYSEGGALFPPEKGLLEVKKAGWRILDYKDIKAKNHRCPDCAKGPKIQEGEKSK